MAVSGGTLKPLYSNRPDRPGVSLKRNSKNHMLLQQPEANDIYCIDEGAVERERTKGRPEPGPINENYHHYRHSLDDRYMLWRNGKKDIDIYDVELMKNDETVPNFWLHQGRETIPLAAVSNREVSKILGLSQLDPNTQVLHYMEKDPAYNNVISSKNMRDVFPTSTLDSPVRRLTTMEVSRDGSTVFVAGKEEGLNGSVGSAHSRRNPESWR